MDYVENRLKMWENISESRYFIKWAFTIYVGTYYLDRVREGGVFQIHAQVHK